MMKSKPSQQPERYMPIAPWVYINDPSGTYQRASGLAALIPQAVQIDVHGINLETAPTIGYIVNEEHHNSVIIISDQKSDQEEAGKQRSVQLLRAASIRNGCNFASVNLYTGQGTNKTSFGKNHLEIKIDETQTLEQSSETIANHIYKWLFSVLTVQETLHLIPDRQMQEIDQFTTLESYTYCPLSESRIRPRDEKIQFVALVLTKPQIGPNQRISWQVADKTGIANFYFQYRGPSSQYTWDWVLSLQPGDRKCLPRMPMLKVTEPKARTVIKTPFRVSATLVGGTGLLLTGVGQGLCKIGKKIKLGNRSEWVAEADVILNKQGKYVKRTGNSNFNDVVKINPIYIKREMKIFNNKGEKMWKDDDSIASTEAGSVYDEKKIQDVM